MRCNISIKKLINVEFILYPFSECAASTTFYVLLSEYEILYKSGFLHSGFVCNICSNKKVAGLYSPCKCSLCPVGFRIHDSHSNCEACPPGNIKRGKFECDTAHIKGSARSHFPYCVQRALLLFKFHMFITFSLNPGDYSRISISYPLTCQF